MPEVCDLYPLFVCHIDLQSEGLAFTFHWRLEADLSGQKQKKWACRISPTGPEGRLQFLGIVEADPARAGLKLAPAGIGALSGLHVHDGEHADAGIRIRFDFQAAGPWYRTGPCS